MQPLTGFPNLIGVKNPRLELTDANASLGAYALYQPTPGSLPYVLIGPAKAPDRAHPGKAWRGATWIYLTHSSPAPDNTNAMNLGIEDGSLFVMNSPMGVPVGLVWVHVVNGTLRGDLIATGGGTNGESAYQLAVDNGYTGTEMEWLATLHGADGTDGTNGTNGTNASMIDVPVGDVMVADGTDTGSPKKWLGEPQVLEGGETTGPQAPGDIDISSNDWVDLVTLATHARTDGGPDVNAVVACTTTPTNPPGGPNYILAYRVTSDGTVIGTDHAINGIFKATGGWRFAWTDATLADGNPHTLVLQVRSDTDPNYGTPVITAINVTETSLSTSGYATDVMNLPDPVPTMSIDTVNWQELESLNTTPQPELPLHVVAATNIDVDHGFMTGGQVDLRLVATLGEASTVIAQWSNINLPEGMTEKAETDLATPDSYHLSMQYRANAENPPTYTLTALTASLTTPRSYHLVRVPGDHTHVDEDILTGGDTLGNVLGNMINTLTGKADLGDLGQYVKVGLKIVIAETAVDSFPAEGGTLTLTPQDSTGTSSPDTVLFTGTPLLGAPASLGATIASDGTGYTITTTGADAIRREIMTVLGLDLAVALGAVPAAGPLQIVVGGTLAALCTVMVNGLPNVMAHPGS